MSNSSKTEQCSRVYIAIDKKTCSTLTSLAQFSSLPFLPSYCQRLLKGNDSTHPLFFIRRDAGPCLLIGQLPAPDRQTGKLIENKSIYISPHGLLMNKGELSFVCVKAGSNVISIYKRYIWRWAQKEVIVVVTCVYVYREMAVYLWLYLVVLFWEALNVVLNFRGTPQAAPSHQTIYVIISNRAHNMNRE